MVCSSSTPPPKGQRLATPVHRALLVTNQRQPAHQTKGANSAPFPAPTLVLDALLRTCKNLHFLRPVKLAQDGGQQSRRNKTDCAECFAGAVLALL